MRLRRRFWTIAVVAGCFGAFAVAASSHAAETPEVEVEAYAGKPFGVGRMTVHRRAGESPTLPDEVLVLKDEQQRVLYPAFDSARLRVPTARYAAGPSFLRAWFLFRGDDALNLTLRTGSDHTAKVAPAVDEDKHRALLDAWWSRYTASAAAAAKADLYPPVVENYLVTTLARRLKLRAAPLPTPWSPTQEANDILALLTGAESVRIAAQSRVLLRPEELRQPAKEPLPLPIATPPVRLPKWDQDAVVEPIAQHVPVECFYVRSGSFGNFQWLRGAIDDWGTNLRHVTSVRGLDYRIAQRLEQQLALRETVLSKLLGETLISDVAIVGTDTFLREGAALGIIFEARNTPLLQQQLTSLRDEIAKENSRAEPETVKIAGREVSLLSTPDNRVRSFYAIDGKYHFITTSRTLVRRFFEAGEGKESLARADEFLWARSQMPLANDYTAFVYLSDPFFRNIIGPHYRVEMTRRARAAAEIDVARLALLAAQAEAADASSVEALTAAGYLPEGFGGRPDESRVVLEDDEAADSLRGAYGAFLPVPDVPIDRITLSESDAYRRFAEQYQREWQQMDPVVVGIRRQKPTEKQPERVTFDIHITPYARSRYQMLATFLTASDRLAWPRIAGDLGTISFELAGHKYAAGLQDFVPQFAIVDGKVHYSTPADDDLPVYVAGQESSKTGGPRGLLGYLLLRIEQGEKPDADGDVRLPYSMIGQQCWQRKIGKLDLVAVNKPMLAAIAPHAKFVEAERPAKLRLRIGDLAGTKVASAINAEAYIRARKVSAGNVAFMETLAQQLHVPADEARAVAERLLDAQLVCPLGGLYTIESGFDEVGRWQSSGWQRSSLYQEDRVPKGFRAPLLDWFAGLLLEFDIDPTTLSTHIELDVRAPK